MVLSTCYTLIKWGENPKMRFGGKQKKRKKKNKKKKKMEKKRNSSKHLLNSAHIHLQYVMRLMIHCFQVYISPIFSFLFHSLSISQLPFKNFPHSFLSILFITQCFQYEILNEQNKCAINKRLKMALWLPTAIAPTNNS